MVLSKQNKRIIKMEIKLIKEAVRRVGTRKYSIVECHCGKQFETDHSRFKTGKLKSCGCLRYKGKNNCKDLAYSSWKSMNSRCVASDSDRSKYHGDKGIKVCARWSGKSGFKNFIADMGPRPSKEYSIDRIDGNKDYEPGNCRWATGTTQQSNHQPKGNVRYVGVCEAKHKAENRFEASVTAKKVRLFREWFATPYEAAIARDQFIIENGLTHKRNIL